MPANSDSVASEFFPGLRSGAESTGAHGSAGAGTGEDDSPLMTVPVTTYYESTQVDQRDRVAVGTGDTSGMSDDVPAHALTGDMPDSAAYMSTGSGSGTVSTPPHRNAGR